MKPTEWFSSRYAILPAGCFIGLIIITAGIAFPLRFQLMHSLELQHKLLADKEKLTKNLDLIKKQLAQLKTIDQHFTELITKYHFAWQNIRWLSHLQKLADEYSEGKPQITLQKIKLSENKTIKIGDQPCNIQLIDMELEASYTGLIDWLMILQEQPALLGIERVLLTGSPGKTDQIQANLTLAIYYP